jgi:hypothetical protein
MSKRVLILAGVAMLVGLLVAVGATAVLAQGGPNPAPSQTPQAWGPGQGLMPGGCGQGTDGCDPATSGRGQGMMGFRGRGMMGDNSLVDIAAEVLGIERTQLVTELQTKSLAEIAGDATKVQTIVDQFMATKRAWLQELVANGRLTQEQANQMLETMQTHVEEQVNTVGLGGSGPHEGCPMGGTQTQRQGGRMGGRWSR